MELCYYVGRGETAACTHPLPCVIHGTHVEPVTLTLNDYEWLIEKTWEGGTQITLRVRRPGLQWLQTRGCLPENGDEDIAATKQFMLRDAGLLPATPVAHVA